MLMAVSAALRHPQSHACLGTQPGKPQRDELCRVPLPGELWVRLVAGSGRGTRPC